MEAKKVLEADLDKDRKQLEAFEKRFERKRARLEGLSDRLQNSPQLHQLRGSGGETRATHEEIAARPPPARATSTSYC